jgi:hypothetical protein
MQPMEKGKTAKRSPPPELPRRSFIVAFDLQGGGESWKSRSNEGQEWAGRRLCFLSFTDGRLWLLQVEEGRCRRVRAPLVFLALVPRVHDCRFI